MAKSNKSYTVTFYDADFPEKKTKVEETFDRLLKAREFSNSLNRERRFISLVNSKGIPLPL